MLTHVKIFIALLLFLASFLLAWLPFPLFDRGRLPKFALLSQFFGRGVFLGAGLIHLLPEAILDLKGTSLGLAYPYLAECLMLFTLIILWAIEQGITRLYKEDDVLMVFGYLVAFMISIHAFL